MNGLTIWITSCICLATLSPMLTQAEEHGSPTDCGNKETVFLCLACRAFLGVRQTDCCTDLAVRKVCYESVSEQLEVMAATDAADEDPFSAPIDPVSGFLPLVETNLRSSESTSGQQDDKAKRYGDVLSRLPWHNTRSQNPRVNDATQNNLRDILRNSKRYGNAFRLPYQGEYDQGRRNGGALGELHVGTAFRSSTPGSLEEKRSFGFSKLPWNRSVIFKNNRYYNANGERVRRGLGKLFPWWKTRKPCWAQYNGHC